MEEAKALFLCENGMGYRELAKETDASNIVNITISCILELAKSCDCSYCMKTARIQATYCMKQPSHQ